MGLILLGTASLLLGPRMSDAQGVLLSGWTSASSVVWGSHCHSAGPAVSSPVTSVTFAL